MTYMILSTVEPFDTMKLKGTMNKISELQGESITYGTGMKKLDQISPENVDSKGSKLDCSRLSHVSGMTVWTRHGRH